LFWDQTTQSTPSCLHTITSSIMTHLPQLIIEKRFRSPADTLISQPNPLSPAGSFLGVQRLSRARSRPNCAACTFTAEIFWLRLSWVSSRNCGPGGTTKAYDCTTHLKYIWTISHLETYRLDDLPIKKIVILRFSIVMLNIGFLLVVPTCPNHAFRPTLFIWNLNPKPRQTCACRSLSLLGCGESSVISSLLPSKPSQTAQLTAWLKTAGFTRHAAGPCFGDFWRFGEEMLRGVEGEETRGKEKER
jgi:hypothetical protein